MSPNGSLLLSIQPQQQQQQSQQHSQHSQHHQQLLLSLLSSQSESESNASDQAIRTTKKTLTGPAEVDSSTINNSKSNDYQENQELLIDNANDTFHNYTDTFDLSLLPQLNNNNNITAATTIAKTITINNLYSTNVNELSVENSEQLDPYGISITRPIGNEIKIEESVWQGAATGNNNSRIIIKEENSPYNCYETNELLQVPSLLSFSNIIYPSPQSSPAQIDYSQQYYHNNNNNYQNYQNYQNYYNQKNFKNNNNDLMRSINVKEEQQYHILPPSPPESSYSETPSPMPTIATTTTTTTTAAKALKISNSDIKSEPYHETDVQKLNDFKLLIIDEGHTKLTNLGTHLEHEQDYQLLREYLEDTTFQRKHNLKPLALDSIINGVEEVPADIEPVIHLALQHVKREAEATCLRLQISPDPALWTPKQAHLWLEATLQQFKLPLIDHLPNIFPETGYQLLQLTEHEFIKRVPECGSTLHAQLELWKLAYSDDYNNKQQQQQQLNQQNQPNQHQVLHYEQSYQQQQQEQQEQQEPEQERQQNVCGATFKRSANNKSLTRTIETIATRAEPATVAAISSSNQFNINLTKENETENRHHQQQSQDLWNATDLISGEATTVTATALTTISDNQRMDIEDDDDDVDNDCLPDNLLHQRQILSTANPSTNRNLNNFTTETVATVATVTATATATATLTRITQTKPATLGATMSPTSSNVSTSSGLMKRSSPRSGGTHIHLWQFLKELLATPHVNGTVIRWLDRQKGIFKIEDSVRVAKLWGKRKNRPAMNYDKLSRSIRQYYKKGIMKKTERSQRLVYQFCQPYHV